MTKENKMIVQIEEKSMFKISQKHNIRIDDKL